MNTTKLALVATLLSLTACGPVSNAGDQQCTSTSCTEAGINAPVPGMPGSEDSPPAKPQDPVRSPATDAYRFPDFDSSWGLPRAMYDKAVDYYDRNARSLANTRYVSVIDMSKHSSTRRWFLFDLKFVKVERYLTTHGANSDKDNDGYAEAFSNVNGSKQSSLGFYKTDSTYQGSNGYSLQLDGLSSTNSNARERYIVVHPAEYVDESVPRAGRSWGCPALDPKIAKSVIDRIKGGSLMLIDI